MGPHDLCPVVCGRFAHGASVGPRPASRLLRGGSDIPDLCQWLPMQAPRECHRPGLHLHRPPQTCLPDVRVGDGGHGGPGDRVQLPRLEHHGLVSPQAGLRRGRRGAAAHPPARGRDAVRAQGQRVHGVHQRGQRAVRVHSGGGRLHHLPARALALPAQRGQRDRHHLQHAHLAEPRVHAHGQPDLRAQHHERRDREVVRHQRHRRQGPQDRHPPLLGLIDQIELLSLSIDRECMHGVDSIRGGACYETACRMTWVVYLIGTCRLLQLMQLSTPQCDFPQYYSFPTS